MPQRSSNGSVLRWPSSDSVLEAAGQWAERQAAAQPELEAVGVFGSYGRGDAGVGSDLDLLLVLRQCELPIWERLRPWDTADLPLATDLLVYSRREWESLPQWNPAFADVLGRDVRWMVSRSSTRQSVAAPGGMRGQIDEADHFDDPLDELFTALK